MSHAGTPTPDSGRTIHEILWSEALPWWLVFRAAGAAFAPTVIFLALLGGLATWAGWSIADSLRLAGSDPAADAILDATLAGGPALVGPDGSGSAAGIAPSRTAVPVLLTAWNWLPRPAASSTR